MSMFYTLLTQMDSLKPFNSASFFLEIKNISGSNNSLMRQLIGLRAFAAKLTT